MSHGENTPGISRLAGAVRDIAELGRDGSLILDFGLINFDGSLVTNSFPTPIPPSDYLVCRCAALPDVEMMETVGHAHDSKSTGVTVTLKEGGEPPHTHAQNYGSTTAHKVDTSTDTVNIARPSQRHLVPGDRVLVAWVQNDAVVIDIIYHANQIL